MVKLARPLRRTLVIAGTEVVVTLHPDGRIQLRRPRQRTGVTVHLAPVLPQLALPAHARHHPIAPQELLRLE